MNKISEKLIKAKIRQILQKRQRMGVIGTRETVEEEARESLRSWHSRLYFRLVRIGVICLNNLSIVWRWTGIGEKKGWDFLQLGIGASIPLLLFLGTQYFSAEINKQQQEIAKERYQQDTLIKYLEQMSLLLLDKNLRKEESEAHTIARARTLFTLRELDSFRKGLLIKFLAEANLIFKDKTVIYLRDADISSADLEGADLEGADLRGVDLRGANLRGVNLREANLEGADLREAFFSVDPEKSKVDRLVLEFTDEYLEKKPDFIVGDREVSDPEAANLTGANLTGANLERADFFRVNLEGANLREANLEGADFCRADLRNVDLSGAYIRDRIISLHEVADLEEADFYRADLRGASLEGADLRHIDLRKANLRGANLKTTPLESLTPKQVKSACNWRENSLIPEDFRQKLEKEPDQQVDCSKWKRKNGS